MRSATTRLLALAPVLLLTACGAAGGSSNDWYYHWSCNGDPECLALNPGAMGQASGTVGPEAGGQSGCNSLLIFGSKNWNIPPAAQSCDNSPNAPPATITSLTISPANSSMPVGLTRQFTATGRYSDGTTRDLTTQVAWSTSPTTIGSTPVATVAAGGLVRAGALGTITLFADYGSLRASTMLYVGAASVQSITVTPASPSIDKGTTQQFTAMAHYSDGTTTNITSTAYWTSATTSVATVGYTGLATSLAVGSSVITAYYGSVSGSSVLTVTGATLSTIYIAPSNPAVAQSFGVQFRAIGIYSDGSPQDLTGQVTWTSATGSVATIDAAGLATGLAPGTSSIKAASGASWSTTTLTVTAATLVSITITPPTPIIAPGTTVPFTATGTFSDGSRQVLSAGVNWSSDTTPVATVDSSGLASAVSVGTSTVKASLGAVSATSLLTVKTTPPGVAWAYLPSSPPVTYGSSVVTSIVWSGTQFVAVVLSGAIVTSPDGLTWTTRLPGVSPYGPLFSVTWAPELSLFVAVGAGSIMTSPDGITWTPNSVGAISTAYLNGLVWTGTQFVAVGNVGGTPTQVIMTSTDGLSWISWPSLPTGILRSVAWSGSVLVAVGDVTQISTNTVTWTMEADTTIGWTGVTWTGSQFVEVGVEAAYTGSTGKVRTSPDGLTWTDRPVTSPPLYGVAWTGTELIAMGGSGGTTSYWGLGGVLGSPGFLSTSTDGITWTTRAVSGAGALNDTTQTIYGVAWNGTRLVAVGSGFGTCFVYTSP